ncbi:MAG: PQQ-dependent sugar dehydrogenase, partial [Pyrinomonadaceae bacterium]|nr:PQQ-dependent sugar dehydrogenase [Pyrinomonadaceae bacterium]
GERGLLGLAFDPNFSSNQFIYFYYTVTSTPRHNRVSRFTANGDVVVPGSEVVILELNDLTAATNHNGGAMHFGEDGKLYIAVGENANAANSQTLNNLLGKMLRINSDGSIPSDNPFFNTATGQNRAIWALGLRNPYTFAFQPVTRRMFINDVGQSAWEEINDGIAGSNYGWPNTEGPTTNPSFRSPIFAYGHGSSDTTGCAITGGTFYNPSVNQFPGEYFGRYFFADFCSGWIRRLNPADNSVTGFATGIPFPVDLRVGPDGNLYYLARGSGSVFRIHYTAALVDVFEFDAAQYNAQEGGGSFPVIVRRTGNTGIAATVDYTAINGSANDRNDYTSAIGTLRFAAGETTKTINILLTDDAYAEGTESLSLTLSNPTAGFSLGNQNTAQMFITDNDTGPPFPNPIDDARFFVRQHYHDFLNREPDQGGLDYWTGQITLCGTNAACLDQRRTAVSAAFFVEQEFQQTGFFIYRFRKASLGVRPTYVQFTRDRGTLQSSTDLETGKQAFAEAFVQQTAFVARYGTSSTCPDFVDALINTVQQGSGVNMTARRTELINECNIYAGNTTVQRARVVRKLIEYQEFVNAEYNPAFVLAQYFEYLRREPDEGGYQFWLDVVSNRDVNNYLGMVQAFIISPEYRQRFGQQ